MKLLKAEPVAVMAVLTAASGLAVLLGASKPLLGAIVTLIGALLAFPVRSAVAPVGKVAEVATQVAAQLDPVTVGLAGTVTDAAAGIVAAAVNGT